MAGPRIKPYDDGYYGIATPTGPVVVSYPIAQQPKALLYSQRHVQTFAAYVAPAFSETMPGNAAFYFVGDTDAGREGSALVAFTRQWANVPEFYSDWDSYVFTYPAYTPSAVPGTPASITAITRTGGNDTVTTGATGITAGEVVFISATFTNGGRTYSQGGYAKVVSAAGGSVTVQSYFVGAASTFSSVSGTIVEAAPGRLLPASIAVASRVLNEFFYTLDPGAIPLAQSFQGVNAAGYPVQALTGGTTTPTSVQYAAMVANKNEIVVETGLVRYLGYIWCRTTRLVTAL